jgi:hypothetical protein
MTRRTQGDSRRREQAGSQKTYDLHETSRQRIRWETMEKAHAWYAADISKLLQATEFHYRQIVK